MPQAIDSTKYAKINYKEPLIQLGDILAITVFSDNPTASAVYNQLPVSVSSPASISNASSAAPAAIGANAGYVVDINGNIYFHSLGNIFVKGLTRAQVADMISEKLATVLAHPYCQVRFINFKVTVLGEVKSPAVISIPSEKVTILEALGLAGDFSDFARRDSILVIRETNTERKFGYVNARDPETFNSEFYYLQQNDVVIVRPVKKKSIVADQVLLRNITILTSVISTIAIVISLTR